MAERDMTGEEHENRADGVPLARRRGDHSRNGRFGLERLDSDIAGELGNELGGDLRGLAGGGGDLANLPPWSVRDEPGRPERDPVALAAWRRVAERRRLRASAAAGDAVPEPVEQPPAEEPVTEPVAEEPAAEPVVEEPVPEPVPEEEPLPESVVLEPVVVEPVVEEPVAEEPADEPEAAPLTIDAAGVDAAGPVEIPGPSAGAGDEPEIAASPVPAARDPHSGPPERPTGAPTGPGHATPSSVRPEGGGRHEVLLSLAGRIDDDALSSVRELVAVEDDASAAELLGGALLAAGAAVTPREHAVLGQWFATSRVDPELADALPRDPEADRRDEHRFSADPPAGAAEGGAGEALARAAARLPEVQRVRQCWRTTPAGSAPGPVPHRVVLVETHSADDCEHVAHHVVHAARELGAVSVEVFASGAELPAYHRAAVRAARPLTTPVTTPPPVPARTGPGAPGRPVAHTEGHPLTRRPDPGPSVDVPGPPPTRTSLDTSVPPVTTSGPDAVPERALPTEPTEEEYRTVAAAGQDPLDRADRVASDSEDEGGVEDAPAPTDAGPELLAAEPESAQRPESIEPPAPPAVDLDPDSTAERIAALWRTPPPEEILSDEHPISSWTDSPLGASSGPTTDQQQVPGTNGADPHRWEQPAEVDPDAATGEFPVVGGPSAATPEPDAVNGSPRRRSRHSRDETGELEAVVEAGFDAAFEVSGPSHTNGHHHGSEHGGDRDAVTEPVHRPRPAPPAPSAPEPHAEPVPPSGPDSVDSQLSDRERELLARLHEELASRERLEPGAPDPLTGRPPAGPPIAPGSQDATAPRPRPTGPPHPGPRPPGPPPAGGPNGYVNGHGLPRHGDHDGEDGTSRDT